MGRSGDWAVDSSHMIPVEWTAADLDGIRPEEEDRPGGPNTPFDSSLTPQSNIFWLRFDPTSRSGAIGVERATAERWRARRNVFFCQFATQRFNGSCRNQKTFDRTSRQLSTDVIKPRIKLKLGAERNKNAIGLRRKCNELKRISRWRELTGTTGISSAPHAPCTAFIDSFWDF